jgi:hypothetical protein
MPFFKRDVLPNAKIPTKLYHHDFGYLEAFGNTSSGVRDFIEGRQHFDDVLGHYESVIRSMGNVKYLIAQLFGDNGRAIEIFAYGDAKWKGNNTGWSFAFRNGIYQSDTRQVTCEDFDIVRGRESELRRSTRDLGEFMSRQANFPNGLLVD